MDKQPTTSIQSGAIPLPLEVQEQLGFADGTPLTLTLQGGSLLVTPVRQKAVSTEEAQRALEAFRAFREPGEPSLEDELYKMRKEEAENLLRRCG